MNFCERAFDHRRFQIIFNIYVIRKYIICFVFTHGKSNNKNVIEWRKSIDGRIVLYCDHFEFELIFKNKSLKVDIESASKVLTILL